MLLFRTGEEKPADVWHNLLQVEEIGHWPGFLQRWSYPCAGLAACPSHFWLEPTSPVA